MTPDGEERLLDGVLCERRISENAHGEAVRGAAVAVIELGERDATLGRRNEREQRLVREPGDTGRSWCLCLTGDEAKARSLVGHHALSLPTTMSPVGASSPPSGSTVTATTAPFGTGSSSRSTSTFAALEEPGAGRLAVSADHPGLVRLPVRGARQCARHEHGIAVRRPNDLAVRAERHPARGLVGENGRDLRMVVARRSFRVERADERQGPGAEAHGDEREDGGRSGRDPEASPWSKHDDGRSRLLVEGGGEDPFAELGWGVGRLRGEGEACRGPLHAHELVRAPRALREMRVERAALRLVERIECVRREVAVWITGRHDGHTVDSRAARVRFGRLRRARAAR